MSTIIPSIQCPQGIENCKLLHCHHCGIHFPTEGQWMVKSHIKREHTQEENREI